jgi:hypothetical protein
MMARRDNPRVIIADWISGFVGDDHPLEHWLLSADQLIGWLRDEGWEITPTTGHTNG